MKSIAKPRLVLRRGSIAQAREEQQRREWEVFEEVARLKAAERARKRRINGQIPKQVRPVSPVPLPRNLPIGEIDGVPVFTEEDVNELPEEYHVDMPVSQWRTYVFDYNGEYGTCTIIAMGRSVEEARRITLAHSLQSMGDGASRGAMDALIRIMTAYMAGTPHIIAPGDHAVR